MKRIVVSPIEFEVQEQGMKAGFNVTSNQAK
jgi:hypothetical protein